jgi:hypothetical protein
MAEVISGDITKGIKNVGELALRISRFDSYRLFTLYENVNSGKLMDVSGNQKYYLVFRSPNKEIRIPEYDPKGFFEVDKVNGCILFKITKKNAEDILSLKTGGEKIFYIIRTYEETDPFGKVLSVTDEVEVYHGKWGDDEAFTTFTTENKVDLLNKALATQVYKNANQMNEYQDLMERYNNESLKTSELEKEIELLRAEVNSLQTQLNEYTGDTYDGTILSTDTKYIAFENSLENITFTEDQYKTAMSELLTKGDVDLTGINEFSEYGPSVDLEVEIAIEGLQICVYKNNNNTPILKCEFDSDVPKKTIFTATNISISHGDVIKFVGNGSLIGRDVCLEYIRANKGFAGAIEVDEPVELAGSGNETYLSGMVNFYKDGELREPDGNIGKLRCYLKFKHNLVPMEPMVPLVPLT